MKKQATKKRTLEEISLEDSLNDILATVNDTNGDRETRAQNHLRQYSESAKLSVIRKCLEAEVLYGTVRNVKLLASIHPEDGLMEIVGLPGQNWTYLHMAVARPFVSDEQELQTDKKLLFLLPFLQGSIDVVDTDGKTALGLAAQNRLVRCVNTLLDAGATVDKNPGDPDGPDDGEAGSDAVRDRLAHARRQRWGKETTDPYDYVSTAEACAARTCEEPIDCTLCLSSLRNGETLSCLPCCRMVCHTKCFQRMERTMAIKGPYMLHCPACRKVLMYEESNEAKIHQAVAIRCSQEEDEVEVEEGDWVQEEYNRVDRSVRQGITTYGGVCDVDAPPPTRRTARFNFMPRDGRRVNTAALQRFLEHALGVFRGNGSVDVVTRRQRTRYTIVYSRKSDPAVEMAWGILHDLVAAMEESIEQPMYELPKELQKFMLESFALNFRAGDNDVMNYRMVFEDDDDTISRTVNSVVLRKERVRQGLSEQGDMVYEMVKALKQNSLWLLCGMAKIRPGKYGILLRQLRESGEKYGVKYTLRLAGNPDYVLIAVTARRGGEPAVEDTASGTVITPPAWLLSGNWGEIGL